MQPKLRTAALDAHFPMGVRDYALKFIGEKVKDQRNLVSYPCLEKEYMAMLEFEPRYNGNWRGARGYFLEVL